MSFQTILQWTLPKYISNTSPELICMLRFIKLWDRWYNGCKYYLIFKYIKTVFFTTWILIFITYKNETKRLLSHFKVICWKSFYACPWVLTIILSGGLHVWWSEWREEFPTLFFKLYYTKRRVVANNIFVIDDSWSFNVFVHLVTSVDVCFVRIQKKSLIFSDI